MDISFDTKEKKAQAIANFTSLLTHPGWKLVEAIVEYNIKVVERQILEGIGDQETIETINRLRDKLAIHKEIIETPKNMIDKLKPSEESDQNLDDPYL